MTTSTPTRRESADELVSALRDARGRAVRWMVERIGRDGKPLGADVQNAWWRVPWALIQAGEMDVAALVLSWIQRHALTAEGDLRPGPFGGDSPKTPVYQLAPVAIAAWQLGRYGLAETVMDRIVTYQEPESRGVRDARSDDSPQDLLKTAQAGIAALVTGRRQMAGEVHGWLTELYRRQPELPSRLYLAMSAGAVVRDFPSSEAFVRLVDFTVPRQAYYAPGIAAAFLAGYGDLTGASAAIALGRSYLRFNIDGTDEQFTDLSSVQICKFGWGAAAMAVADPDGGHLEHVIRMARWFIRRQSGDGSWAPSAFMVPEPNELDRLWKTAEHVLELAFIETALAARRP